MAVGQAAAADNHLPPWAAQLDECYGEDVVVQFHSYPERDMILTLNLPWPQSWFIDYDPGPGQSPVLLNDMPCQPEPVPVVSVRGGFIEARLGQVAPVVDLPEGVRVTYLRIGGVDRDVLQSQYETNYPAALELRNGLQIERGDYMWLPDVDRYGIGGAWYIEDELHMASGDGSSLTQIGCGNLFGDCHGETLLSDELLLSYRLTIDDIDAMPDFIGYQDAMRRTIEGWTIP